MEFKSGQMESAWDTEARAAGQLTLSNTLALEVTLCEMVPAAVTR